MLRLLQALLIAPALLATDARAEDNGQIETEYAAWAAAHIALLPTSFLPGPFGTVADLAALGIEIRQKYLKAKLIQPADVSFYPNAAENCRFSFSVPRIETEYANLLGLFDIESVPGNWGPLGAPTVGHANAEVEVRVSGSPLEGWQSSGSVLSVEAGSRSVVWTAATQLDVVFDVVIPSVLFVLNAELKYSEALLATEPKSAARAAKIGLEFLKNLALETGVTTAGAIASAVPVETARHTRTQRFTVYDVRPPTITTTLPVSDPIEAIAFGGIRWEDIEDQFEPTIIAEDPCDRPLLVGNDAPVLVPIGNNTITWRATDVGPLPPDDSNPGFAEVTQTIIVEDTRAPLVLAPPSRVLEQSTPATAGDVDIGKAVVFDLADPDPVLANTAPTSFPVNARTEVVWSATDDSGNVGTRSQWITVKTPGSNNPPSVENLADNTLTSQPIDLILSGSDPDFLSGRFDPLKFEIVEKPANGFFVAPLMPYFIEDLRVRPTGTTGEIINTSNNPANDLFDQICQQGMEIPIDFVYQPEFVFVDDNGTSFVLDRFWDCGPSDATTRPRISKWDRDGNFVDQQSNISDSVARLVRDEAGVIYTVVPETNSSDMSILRYDADLNYLGLWKIEPPPPMFPSGNLVAAQYDSGSGLIYATDSQSVFIYDARVPSEQLPPFLAPLRGGESFLAGSSVAGSGTRGYYIEIDSLGFVYTVDSGGDQVHRFEPSRFESATFIPGEHIGWMGRCDSGPNCDDENGRSFGYSCTDSTCTVSDSAGVAPGQFDTPLGIALDPEDTLYVTDYNNLRVQRFTPLGDFAGEAGSTCDGGCFVLGDFGRPLDISVNSDQFFVLDRDRALMHIFETAPFKDIMEDSVVVSYASDNDFQGTDSFTFRANDGLADSNTGTARITVSRAFRAPEAMDLMLQSPEDQVLSIDLPASDLDGIAGVDFNGLDTLSYEIVTPPAFGTLSGTGKSREYTPNPDFFGQDELQFRVDDGREVSNIATVSIDITPVNDAPTVRLTNESSKIVPKVFWPLLEKRILKADKVAPLGFPLPLMAEFDDVDPGDVHMLTIDWGDGTVEVADASVPDTNKQYEGPVITPTFEGTGMITGEHSYLDQISRQVEICVEDAAQARDCIAVPVEVEPMVDLTIEDLTDRQTLPLPGSVVTLAVGVTNAAPESPVSGLESTNTVFTTEAPEGTTPMGVATNRGSCMVSGQQLSCALGTVAVGSEVLIELELVTAVDFDADGEGATLDVVSDQPDATDNNITELAIPVAPQRVFEDGFE